MHRVAVDGYKPVPGACRGGFDIVSSQIARAASDLDACARACTAHGDECIAASWYHSGPTLYNGVRSQCWLSRSCAEPDCCRSAFLTLLKRRHAKTQRQHDRSRAPSMDRTCSTWRPASPHELGSALRPEQGFIGRLCDGPYRHACLGACRDDTHFLPSRSHGGLVLACNDTPPAASHAAATPTHEWTGETMTMLLREHARPPSCRLSFAGDSLMHDVWAAALAAAYSARLRLVACSWGSVNEEWIAKEHAQRGAGLCGGNASAAARALRATMELGVDRAYTSWAAFELPTADEHARAAAATCSRVVLQYWEVGRDYSKSKHQRPSALRPTASVVAEASSLVRSLTRATAYSHVSLLRW
jgi:hypothetical protein